MRQQILVVDFGAGTLEAGLIAIDGDRITLVAQACNPMLGGHDCDEALVAHLCADFHAAHAIDLRADPIAHARLRGGVQAARERLTDAEHTTLTLPHLAADAAGSKLLERRLDRAFVLEATVDHLAAGAALCREVLAQAELAPDAIDGVWSLGGMRHTPGWPEALAALTPAPISYPDDAVVQGTARLAAMLAGVAPGPTLALPEAFAATPARTGAQPGLSRDEVDAIVARDRAVAAEEARQQAHAALMARARALLASLAQAQAQEAEAAPENPTPMGEASGHEVLGDADGLVASANNDDGDDSDTQAQAQANAEAADGLGAAQDDRHPGTPPLWATMAAVERALAGDLGSPEAHAHLAQQLQSLDIAAARWQRGPGRA